MIKKNTKIVWRDQGNDLVDELKGGVPLFRGETIRFRLKENPEPLDYEVIDKVIDYIIDGEDHIINITYTIERKYR